MIGASGVHSNIDCSPRLQRSVGPPSRHCHAYIPVDPCMPQSYFLWRRAVVLSIDPRALCWLMDRLTPLVEFAQFKL